MKSGGYNKEKVLRNRHASASKRRSDRAKEVTFRKDRTVAVIAAIPTRYAGVQFRSRLEARWAAFFDQMRWRWRYEPFDTAGWIPDFVLGENLNDGLLVEVKPIFWVGEKLEFGEHAAEIELAIRNSAGHVGLLVCGLEPIILPLGHETPPYTFSIGPIWETKMKRFNSAHASLNENTGIYDFAIGSDYPVYPGAITGIDYATEQDGFTPWCNVVDCELGWKNACNIVQYKGSSS